MQVTGHLYPLSLLRPRNSTVTLWIGGLRGVREVAWKFRKREKSYTPTGIQTPDIPARSLGTKRTMPLWFRTWIRLDTFFGNVMNFNFFKAWRFLYIPPGLILKYSTWRSLCVECFVRISERTATFASYIINPLNTKRRLLYLKTQFAPRSKHISSRL